MSGGSPWSDLARRVIDFLLWNEFSLFLFFFPRKKRRKGGEKVIVNEIVMNREVKARYYLDTFSEPVEGIRWSWTSALSSNWRGRRRSGSFERSSCLASGICRSKEWRTMEMGSLADLSTHCTRPPAPGHRHFNFNFITYSFQHTLLFFEFYIEIYSAQDILFFFF